MTIYKYKIGMDFFRLDLPKDAKILTVQTQDDEPVIWALVEPGNEPETRCFLLAGTGHPITENDLKYIGTFQMPELKLVFHLFEI